MEEIDIIDIILCLKTRQKKLKNTKKIIQRLKNLNLVINILIKSFFNYINLIVHAMIQLYTTKSIICMSFRQTDRDKNLIVHD